MSSLIHIPKLLSVCKKLAIQSGNVIRHIKHSGNLGVQVKSTLYGIEDYVTRADIQAQRVIVDGLSEQWPNLYVVAEEDESNHPKVPLVSYATTTAAERTHNMEISAKMDVAIQNVTVWVDPLDATREFAKGTNLDCVFCLIGISVLGAEKILHNCYQDLKFYQRNLFDIKQICGIVGGAVEGLHPSPPHQGLVLTTTALRHTSKNDEAVQMINPTEVIHVGGAGYKAMLVMENKADVYLYNAGGCKLWDTCASHAILKALGGNMTKVDGSEIVYSLDHLQVPSLVASLKNHKKYINMIAGINKSNH